MHSGAKFPSVSRYSEISRKISPGKSAHSHYPLMTCHFSCFVTMPPAAHASHVLAPLTLKWCVVHFSATNIY